MNKKIFIALLFLISLIVLAGGCGGGHSDLPVTGGTEVDAALSGAWTTKGSGTATLAGINTDSDELEQFRAFGEIPDEVLKQYQEQQAKKAAKTITAPVTRAVAFFENSNISGTNGTLKLTAVFIVSDDSNYLPIVFNGVTLTTTSSGTNSWTAATPDGGTLTINMPSEEKINISGKISYLDYNCEFSTSIEKSQANPIDPAAILDGTWTLDGTQSGGCLADSSSKVTAAVVPEVASIAFTKTNNISSSHISQVKNGADVDAVLSLFQSIKPSSEATLSQLDDNVYKLKDANGNETLIFIENSDEIFVIKNESEDNTVQATEFLPLKKVNLDIETALNKNWTASEGDGGGWIYFYDITKLVTTTDPTELEFLKLLEYVSFSLKTASLKFSGVTANDDGTITAKMNVSASLSIATEFLKTILPADKQVAPVDESGTVTMTKSGNSWHFENDGDIYNASFISDKELILSVYSLSENEGYGEFVIRFRAN